MQFKVLGYSFGVLNLKTREMGWRNVAGCAAERNWTFSGGRSPGSSYQLHTFACKDVFRVNEHKVVE